MASPRGEQIESALQIARIADCRARTALKKMEEAALDASEATDRAKLAWDKVEQLVELVKLETAGLAGHELQPETKDGIKAELLAMSTENKP